jgi:hypothetical protein
MMEEFPLELLPDEVVVRYCLGNYFKQGEFLVFPAKFIVSINLWLTNKRVCFCERNSSWWKANRPCENIRFSNIYSVSAKHLPIRGRYNFVEIDGQSQKWLFSVDDVDYQIVLDILRASLSDNFSGAVI